MTKEDNKMSALMEKLRCKVDNASQNDEIVIEKSTVIDIIQYIQENEENKEVKEDTDLSARYGSRTDLSEEQWIKKDPKQSINDWYKERKRERLNEK
ncbi:hypothetical protein [Bacillus toyonensis]|uniref:hypothetical protein n=1 Tax=Bacillus toyonensis TaxID=155322 RepID=UPI002E1FBC0D|nr:hypothetical protein [Bacillus toyonensis]